MNRSIIACVGAACALLTACDGGSQDQAQNAAVNAAAASAEAANASATASVAANNAAVASAKAAQTAAAATNTVASAAAGATAPPSMSGADFVGAAASTDRYEIAAARLALTHASRSTVKAFAQMMIRDHTASTAKLMAAIATSGQPLTSPRDLPADLQVDLATLRTASGSEFDRGYIGQMVDTHDRALQTMQSYAIDGAVPALKTFAAAVTPVVQSHLSRAQTLQAKIGR
jgi:putative membrane protein